MYIYRVEDPDTGKGPYSPGKNASMEKHLLDDDLGAAHNDCKYHPQMFDDCFYEFYEWKFPEAAKAYFAGTHSAGQLYTWFFGFWPRLDNTGYTIRIYDCPDTFVKVGNYQVCFPLAMAKKIDEMPISDFLAILG